MGDTVICKCTPLNYTNSAIWQNVNVNNMCCMPNNCLRIKRHIVNIGRYSEFFNKIGKYMFFILGICVFSMFVLYRQFFHQNVYDFKPDSSEVLFYVIVCQLFIVNRYTNVFLSILVLILVWLLAYLYRIIWIRKFEIRKSYIFF